MDRRTGEIASLDSFKKRLTLEEIKKYVVPVDEKNLSRTVRNVLAQTGRAQLTRNSRCSCGSGKRFKNCCMIKQ